MNILHLVQSLPKSRVSMQPKSRKELKRHLDRRRQSQSSRPHLEPLTGCQLGPTGRPTANEELNVDDQKNYWNESKLVWRAKNPEWRNTNPRFRRDKRRNLLNCWSFCISSGESTRASPKKTDNNNR
uniref:Uncharacterized protein n=1 Tax=Oryza barthii TaxID=65489 RepID=A0A0D3H4F5_9ORYZ